MSTNDPANDKARPAALAVASCSARPPESQSDSRDVICPYCLCRYQAEAEDFNENEHEETCFNCGRTYLLYSELDITHHTRPLPNTKDQPRGTCPMNTPDLPNDKSLSPALAVAAGSASFLWHST